MAYICRARPWVRIPGGRICCAQKLPNLGGSGGRGPGGGTTTLQPSFLGGAQPSQVNVKCGPGGFEPPSPPPVADPRKGGRLSQLDHRAGATNTRRS